MKTLKKFFIGLTIFFIIAGVVVLARNNKTQVEAPAAKTQKPALDAVKKNEFQDDYQKKVKEILKPYFNKEPFTNVSQGLSALTVPYNYRDLHLELVIAFSMIEQGQVEADQGKIEEGIFRINELMEKYQWLQ